MASDPQVYSDVPFKEGTYELRTSVPRNRKGKFYCRECHDFYDVADFSPYIRETANGPRLSIMANCVHCRTKKLEASRGKAIAARRENADKRREQTEEEQARLAEEVLQVFDAVTTAEATEVTEAIDAFMDTVIADVAADAASSALEDLQDEAEKILEGLVDPYADVIIEDISPEEPTLHEDHVMQTTATHQTTERPHHVVTLVSWLDAIKKPYKIQLFVTRNFTVAYMPPAADDEACYHLFIAQGGPGERLSRSMLSYVLNLLYPNEILANIEGELLS